MNKLLALVGCLAFGALVLSVEGSKKISKMTPEFERANKFFVRTGKIANLAGRVTSSLPPSFVTDIAVPTLDGVGNISLIASDFITKIGGDDKQFEDLMTRMHCLLDYDDRDLKAKKDPKCPPLGCIDTDTCFALAMRDVIRVLEPMMAQLVGKSVVDASGKLTGEIEPGLMMNVITVLTKIIDLLTQQNKPSSGDKETAKYSSKLSTLKGQLDAIKTKLLKPGQNVLVLTAKAFQPLPAAFDVAAVIISSDALDYIDIPPTKKNTIKTNAGEEGGFGEFEFDKKTIEKDFNDLGDFE